MASCKSKKSIENFTETYCDAIRDQDIGPLLDVIREHYSTDIKIFDYMGLLDVPENFDKLKERKKRDVIDKSIINSKGGFKEREKIQKSKKKRQAIIVAVTLEDGGDHYMGLLRNNDDVYIWDSASKNALENPKHEIYYIAENLFPGLTIRPVKTSNIFQPAGGGSENILEQQNIFCHTWSMWFFHIIFCLCDSKLSNLSFALDAIEGLDNSDQERNLSHIKQYALFLTRYFDINEKTEDNIKKGLSVYVNKKGKITPVNKYQIYFEKCMFK